MHGCCSIDSWYFLEFQHAVSYPMLAEGDRHPQPGGGGDGCEVQDGGGGGLGYQCKEHSV